MCLKWISAIVCVCFFPHFKNTKSHRLRRQLRPPERLSGRYSSCGAPRPPFPPSKNVGLDFRRWEQLGHEPPRSLHPHRNKTMFCRLSPSRLSRTGLYQARFWLFHAHLQQTVVTVQTFFIQKQSLVTCLEIYCEAMQTLVRITLLSFLRTSIRQYAQLYSESQRFALVNAHAAGECQSDEELLDMLDACTWLIWEDRKLTKVHSIQTFEEKKSQASRSETSAT